MTPTLLPSARFVQASRGVEPHSRPLLRGLQRANLHEPVVGTFEVAVGSDTVGCNAGSVVEGEGPAAITNEFTCEDGEREGRFTIQWRIIDGADGPGDVNGPWTLVDATGDFVGLTGEGAWSGTSDGSTGLGTFSGVVEFDS